MALQNAATRSTTCSCSQAWLLRSFMASVGGASSFSPAPSTPPRRAFSRVGPRRNEARQRIQKESYSEGLPLNDINDYVSSQNPRQSSSTTPAADEPPRLAQQEKHIPWYLQPQHQLQRREEAANPFAARQRLPDLPEHAPPILQPLLEHVSVNLGMDDLTLLDLREIDPPPALGANLLMVIGTARSDKHLHVGADRLCRWLRTEHRLSPYADGLLGRNELKLKIRRRTKRSRLLSTVGTKATADTEIDEGIRTGWVCVNVGRVPGGELPEGQRKVQRAEGIVGFGGRTDGSVVVVQMMTEEKRGEIDLEALWTGILNRARRDSERDVLKDATGGAGVVDVNPSEDVDVMAAEPTASTTHYQPVTSVDSMQPTQPGG